MTIYYFEIYIYYNTTKVNSFCIVFLLLFKTNFFFNIVLSLLIIFFKLIIINSSVLDMFFRLSLNDSFINLYSFFWTNFWYLFFFFFLFIFILLFYYFNFFYILYFLPFFIFLFFYSFEVYNFFLPNFQLKFFISNYASFNTFLLNNINKYHPFIFYWSCLLLLLTFFIVINFFVKDGFYFKKEYVLNQKINNFYLIFLINAFSLFLGSWWAMQEGSWGGWWNWDASETLGLLILLLVLIFTHYSYNYASYINYIYTFLMYFFFIIFIYYFVQLNFDLVSHNFGIKFFYFFNNNLFLLESIYFYLFLIFFSLLKFFFFSVKIFFLNNNFNNLLTWRLYKYFIIFFLLIIILKSFLVSFNFLFNYFLWTFLFLNTLNYEFDVLLFSVGFILIYLLIFNNIKFFFFSIIFFFNNFFFLSFYLLPFYSFFNLLHFTVFNFFYINILSINLNFLVFDNFGIFYFIFFDNFFYFFGKKLIIDSLFYEPVFNCFYANNLLFSWTLNNLISFFNHSLFSFPVSSNTFFNLINLNYNLSFIFLYLEFLNINNLFIFFLFLFLFFLSFFFKKNYLTLRLLFQRLYNWIKYKTLPSSFLFKNRLFIERDSKHRRVMSNFGLSFRNSKWSSYETYNIKSQFRSSYLKYISWISFFFFLFFFILYFKKYYIFFYFFNSVSFLFWISIDTFDYYLSFLVWTIGISFSIFFNLIYSYFFFNNFSTQPSNKNFHITFLNSRERSNYFNKDLYVSKHDLNWILYAWLTNSTSRTDGKILESLFDSEINKKWWNENYDFFIKLYRLTYLLNLASEKSNAFYLSSQLNRLSNKYFKGDYCGLINYFNNNNILNNYSSVILYYFLNNYKNYFEVKNNNSSSLNFLNNRYEWNLYNFNYETEKYAFLLKNKIGLFFLNDFNYQKLSYFIFNFEELWSLNFYLKNQINAAKWNRWLYKYSILHRKILKNSHKLTLAKRLVNSGFYDSKLTNKNVWASAHLNKINYSENFSSFFNVYYNNLFNTDKDAFINHKTNINNNGNQVESLSLLNFYENSYFWYLKRFYLFNTLSNNSIKSKNLKTLNTFFKDNLLEKKNNLFSKYSLFLNYLLKSTYINLNTYSHFNNSYVTFNELYESFSPENDSNKAVYNLKDIYLLNSDNDLLSKDNLNILYWITSNTNKNNNLIFFKYLNYNSSTGFKNAFFNKNTVSFNNNYWLIYSLINLDRIFLNDVVYLSLFY